MDYLSREGTPDSFLILDFYSFIFKIKLLIFKIDGDDFPVLTAGARFGLFRLKDNRKNL